MFFSFDGIDGVGKTTQVQMLCDALRERDYGVLVCRDPGSTELGERIRELLLNGEGIQIEPRTEMLLYMAARAQLVDEVIRPTLAAGKIVVADRYLLANVVYQGYAGGLDPGMIRQIGQLATASLMPECVFLLDMAPEAADRRMDRPLDRMENRGREYRARLRDGFLAEAAMCPEVRVIDADRPAELVHAEIWQIAVNILSAGHATFSEED